MLGLLPLEKIPIFVWALVLFFSGVFLAIHESFMVRAQLINLGMIVIGGVAFFYDVKRRIVRSRAPADASMNEK